MTLATLLELADLTLRLGQINRVTRHPDGTLETDTTHTVMLGIVAREIAADLNRRRPEQGLALLDLNLVAALALVHDLTEVKTGDTDTFGISPDLRAVKEWTDKIAVGRLCAELMEGGACATWALLVGYEAQETPEARLVKLVDKVLPRLVHTLNAGATYRDRLSAEGFRAMDAAHVAQLEARFGAEFPEVIDMLRQAGMAAYAAQKRVEAR